MKITPTKMALWVVMLLLAACSSDEGAVDVDKPDIIDNHAVKFSAYSVRTSRASSASNIVDLDALAVAGGFGVFGYDQGELNYHDFCLVNTNPLFFYNQQVQGYDGDGNLVTDAANQDVATWTYSPVRYFNNTPDSRHSFFAYAPYSSDIEPVFNVGMAPQINYSVSQDIDMLWAKPVIDMRKPGVDEKILFDFYHALSKVTFRVAPFINAVHSDDHHNENMDPGPGNPINGVGADAILESGTTVKVRRISFVGVVPHKAKLNLSNGDWSVDGSELRLNLPDVSSATWTGDGVNKQQYKSLNPIMPIPAQELRLEIVYDVIVGTGDDQKIVTYRAESQEKFALEGGHAYDFYLDLGLNTIKFSATSADWNNKEVDVDLDKKTLLWVETIKWIQRIQEVEL